MLSAAEKKELEMLEAEEAQAQQIVAQPQGLTPEEQAELQALEAEEAQAQQMLTAQPRVDYDDEADLGTLNRLQYSLEPLESNRRAFLVREFGAENVMQDKEGEVYLRQGGEWRPVNKEGISMADIADVAGSTPEILGAGAGALLGFGTASIPAAAAGAGAGSIIRQGLSSAIGTPQVATTGERVAEVGLSTAFGAGGAAVGKGLKEVGKKVAPRVAKVLRKSFFDSNKRVGKFLKGLEGRGGDADLLEQTAKKYGLPEPTKAQIAGGDAYDIERALSERPVWGRGIRKKFEEQTEAIKKNLKEEIGDFVQPDAQPNLAKTGASIKSAAENVIESTKNRASELFDDVAATASDVKAPAKQVRGELLSSLNKFGLFDKKGNPLPHSAKTGLKPDEFKKLQTATGGMLRDLGFQFDVNDLGDIKSLRGVADGFGDVDANFINTWRQYINDNISYEKGFSRADIRLKQLEQGLLDLGERMLDAADPESKVKWQTARKLWSEQLRLNQLFKKSGNVGKGKGIGIANLSEDKVLKTVFSNRQNVKSLIELTDQETAKKAGLEYIRENFLKKFGEEGQKSAQGAFSFLRDNKDALETAIGRKTYKKLFDLVYFQKKLGKPFNTSKTGIMNILNDELFSVKGVASGLAQTAERGFKNLGTGTLNRAISTGRNVPKYLAPAAAALGEPTQRETSYLMRPPGMR